MLHKERYEWMNVWVDEADKNDLPRILLVGDSITQGYQSVVRNLCKGIAYVDYITTSFFSDSPIYNVFLSEFIKTYGKYSLIHFNQGLHGYHMNRDDYEKNILSTILLLEKESKLIVANTTNVYEAGLKAPSQTWSDKIIERNNVVENICNERKITLDDLYSVSKEIPMTNRSNDGFHYTSEGYYILGKKVFSALTDSITNA